MTTTVFLAWQDARRTRAWYPIGRLDAMPGEAQPLYRFRYIRGAERAHREAGMEPLQAFPELYRQYESADLFPLFRNRLLTSNREDMRQYLRLMDLDPKNADPLEVLGLTEGRRQTDNLEVFPKINRNADGGFLCKFFLHGWRHLNEDAQRKLESLKPGTELRVAIELNNPATGLAVQLQTTDSYHMLGWTPRYLVIDLVQALQEQYQSIHARLVKSISGTVPFFQRFMIELCGNWPKDHEPMSSEDFETINHGSLT